MSISHKVHQEYTFKRLILFLCSCPVLDHKGTIFKYDLIYSYKFYILYIQYILRIELVNTTAASEIFVFNETHQTKGLLKGYEENQQYYIMSTASTIFHSI